jgi:hypothetical protein
MMRRVAEDTRRIQQGTMVHAGKMLRVVRIGCKHLVWGIEFHPVNAAGLQRGICRKAGQRECRFTAKESEDQAVALLCAEMGLPGAFGDFRSCGDVFTPAVCAKLPLVKRALQSFTHHAAAR